VHRRHQPLDIYVTLVVATGVACAAFVLGTGYESIDGLLEPELALFALCALVGELVPLKVHTRGSEGEVTTSTCFALALMLAGGPAVALTGLVAACIIADAINGKSAKKIAFNASQYAISVSAASLVLVTLTDVPREGTLPFEPIDLVAILGVATVFFVVNSALVSTVVALAQGVINLGRYLANDLFFQASTAGLLLGLSPVVVLAAEFSLPALLLLLLPFLAVHRGGRAAIAKEHQSLHDALTGLPNRTLFRDRIEQAITAGRRSEVASAVMLIDLDHFKEINDTLGHHAGDRLLEEVAHRLENSLGERDTVARLGGDEFGVLLPSLRRPGDANVVARQLLAGLREPFSIEGLTLEVDASIGMACHPAHGTGVETLIQRADIAMYSAKEGGGGHAMFEARLDRFSPRRLSLAGGLRQAIQNGEITLFFQPKAELESGTVIGVEALARWDHPRLGLVGPTEFVPIAEQTGLIAPLTSYVLDAALRQVREWMDEGRELSVAVNLSARSFLDAQLAIEIPRLLEKYGVDARLLELEITESMLMLDPGRAQAVLERLSRIGLTLSVDDFGTGYSSLANLKRLPVDVIKIDKSFVMDMAIDASDAAIVRSTIDLAHNLGLRVVAEGVESHQAWTRLCELGCDLAQGFYVSRPLPAADLRRLLRERSARQPEVAADAMVPESPPALRVIRAQAS
jgi:diguanylate cyclase (GGDEF)-like protein